ncbi:uncharacterized protein BYT42DRAFT_646593 [Radiomyces spectabilis]|uniref:uncharacterized protein n=1 Tax=Radiomyces spectabilis TaxID=64574 RepID=UPI0022203617|nr:uncharacterized protein BYT42DRAFT_646593 [Radiomyces spectabilis]KAI8374656.1 hypothetical protein BYT42DRAFT_646593 [Radiomyces spectabilis]
MLEAKECNAQFEDPPTQAPPDRQCPILPSSEPCRRNTPPQNCDRMLLQEPFTAPIKLMDTIDSHHHQLSRYDPHNECFSYSQLLNDIVHHRIDPEITKLLLRSKLYHDKRLAREAYLNLQLLNNQRNHHHHPSPKYAQTDNIGCFGDSPDPASFGHSTSTTDSYETQDSYAASPVHSWSQSSFI